MGKGRGAAPRIVGLRGTLAQGFVMTRSSGLRSCSRQGSWGLTLKVITARLAMLLLLLPWRLICLLRLPRQPLLRLLLLLLLPVRLLGLLLLVLLPMALPTLRQGVLRRPLPLPLPSLRLQVVRLLLLRPCPHPRLRLLPLPFLLGGGEVERRPLLLGR